MLVLCAVYVNRVWNCVQCVVCVQCDFVCVGVSMWLQCGGKACMVVYGHAGVCVWYTYMYICIYMDTYVYMGI